jgi:hypothetical protein
MENEQSLKDLLLEIIETSNKNFELLQKRIERLEVDKQEMANLIGYLGTRLQVAEYEIMKLKGYDDEN